MEDGGKSAEQIKMEGEIRARMIEGFGINLLNKLSMEGSLDGGKFW